MICRRNFLRICSVTLLLVAAACATSTGNIRGIVHDPQHRPVSGAMVMLRSVTSDWTASASTSGAGEFQFMAVPIGDFTVSIASPGFEQVSQTVTVTSGAEPVLHFQLRIATGNSSVTVSETLDQLPPESATPSTLISRLDVQQTPGAARSNSLALITDFVPGAYFTHDQLHMRGGHQTSWLLDGVPVPNTNIASNVAPQLDPKDIDYLEVERGSYSAELGDRTYGVFDVVPRSGFERNNEAELVLSAGNFYQTNDAFSLGSHTSRFAYYASVNANRSDLGLQPPVAQVVHDAENGYGGFGSLIFNVDRANQLRFVTSVRRDFYQIPYDPFQADLENGASSCTTTDPNAQYPTFCLRDAQHEADAVANFSWVHTFDAKTLITISPFYHYNRANYDSPFVDFPTATTDHRSSTYAGGQVAFRSSLPGNDLQVGAYGFYQQNDEFFGVTFNDGSSQPLDASQQPNGGLAALFLDDKFKPTSWMSISAGLRPTHFSGPISESSISPRFGAALTIPKLHWTFRGFYGHYYQAPPLITVSGSLQVFCPASQCFVPLQGERDEEHQFGLTIPYRGWILDADAFRTSVRNFFDHNCIGSGACFPITVDHARITGWELTLRSPRIARRGQLHLAYSNQVALQGGGVIGGLTNNISNVCPGPPGSYCPLDHDQRNTLNIGGNLSLPWRTDASTNVYFGSGFSNAFPGQPYPGDHLPGHTSFDLALGKAFTDSLSASLNMLNVANRRVELDNSQTFGGFHWNNPREIYVELRYRFHY